MRKPKPLPRPRLVYSDEAQPQQKYHTFKHLPSRYNESDLNAIEICGDSLEKVGIPRGHMVAVAKGAAVSSGDLVAVNLCDEPNGYVRYAYFGPGGWVRLQSADRDEYPDLIYQPGDFEIMGPVVHAESCTPRWKQSA